MAGLLNDSLPYARDGYVLIASSINGGLDLVENPIEFSYMLDTKVGFQVKAKGLYSILGFLDITSGFSIKGSVYNSDINVFTANSHQLVLKALPYQARTAVTLKAIEIGINSVTYF